MRNSKTFWRLASLCLFPLLLFVGCGKEKDVETEKESISISIQQTPEPSPAPDSYTVEPNAAEAVIEAYLLCLKDGQGDKAQQYVWPMAEAQPGEATRNFWQPFDEAGYSALASYEIQKVGESPLYTVYNVDLRFTMPAGQQVSDESIAAGNIYVEPMSPEEIQAELDEAVPERSVSELLGKEKSANTEAPEDQPLDEADLSASEEAEVRVNDADETDENDADGNDESGANAENTAESASASPTPSDKGTEEVVPGGHETVMLTVVYADNRYYVSPENLLVVYEASATPSRLELERQWAQDEENSLAEIEGREVKTLEAPEVKGVYAQVVYARRYVDSLSVNIRFENYGDAPFVLGEEDFPPTVAITGVYVGPDNDASPELADEMGFTRLTPSYGAKGGTFDTFAPHVILEPGAPEVSTLMENVSFLGNYELIYSMFLPDFDGGVLGIGYENMVALPGYLDLGNPFADFEVVEDDGEIPLEVDSTGEDDSDEEE